MAAATRAGRGGSKKYGRNKDKCTRYKLSGRREKNKKQRMEKREKKLAHRKAIKEKRLTQ